MKNLLLFCACLCLSATAWAAGGSCPTNPGVPAGVTSCYYVSTSGSDSNSGTTETAPLKHLPGMPAYTGTISFGAGTGFILKGCDVFPNSNLNQSLPLVWSVSGTSANPIYIGVDKTWFSASCTAWNRPVFSGGNIVTPSNAPLIQVNANFVEFQWIEIANYFWNNATPQLVLIGNGDDNVTLDNMYIHHWTHGASAVDTDNMLFKPNGSPAGRNSTLSNSVIDNLDGDGATCTTKTDVTTTCSGGGVSVGFIINNVFKGMPTEAKGGVGTNGMQQIVGNYFCCVGEDTWSSPPNHPNYLETIVGGGTLIIANNHWDVNGIGESMQIGNPGETDIVFNNVLNMVGGVTCGNGGCNVPQIPQTVAPSWSITFFNNTVYNGVCANWGNNGGTTLTNLIWSNNHCINGSGATHGGNMTPTGINSQQTNLGQTITAANAQGYTGTETFIASPISSCTSSTCSTVANGTNLAIDLPSGFSSTDTAYGCTEQTISGVVESVCPARTTITRGPNWDIGAYQATSSGSTGPAASFAPPSLSFANQPVTTSSATQTTVLTNTGTSSLTIFSISIAGTNSGDFSQTNTCGATLAVNASCNIVVTFTPIATGARTATVSVSDNASGSPQTVALSGTGSTFTLSAQSNALGITVGGSGQDQITVTSVSGFAQAVNLTITGTPANVIATFTPSSLTPTAQSMLSFTSATNATPGVYPLTVTATGGGLQKTTNVALTVNACSAPYCFTGTYTFTGTFVLNTAIPTGPMVYTGPTSLAAITYPSTPPNVGGINDCGTKFTDPLYTGAQGIRVTCGNFDPSFVGNVNNVWQASNGGSADDLNFNSNSTMFFVTNLGGFKYVVRLDPNAFTLLPRPYATNTLGCPLNSGNCSIRGGWATTGALIWSQIDPNKLYVAPSGGSLSSSQLTYYIFDGPQFVTPPTQVVLGDYQENAPAGCTGTSCNCLPGDFGPVTWISDGGVGGGDATFSRAFSSAKYSVGGTGQNTGFYAAVFSPTKGCMALNTQTGVITADVGWGGGSSLTCTATQCTGTTSSPLDMTIHNVKLNGAGNRVSIAAGNTCISGCGSSDPVIWAFQDDAGHGSNVIYQPETVAGHKSGHWALGQLGFINDPGAINGQFNYWLTSATGPPATFRVVNNVPSPPCAVALDEHHSWQTANSTDTSAFVFTFGFDAVGQIFLPIDQPLTNCPWWGEIDVADMNGDMLVHREALTFNTMFNPAFEANNVITGFSQDGRFVDAPSDWFNTLRNAPGTSASCVPAGPKWVAGAVRGPNYVSKPTTAPNNAGAFSFQTTAGGTGGTVEPVWPQTIGNTVADGTITWTNIGKSTGATACAAEVFLWKLW